MIEERDEQYDDDRENIVDEFEGIDPEESPEETKREQIRQWEEKLQIFGNGVEADADEAVRLRMPVELRMLEDTRQYMGVDDEATKRSKNPDQTASDLNVNITRKKTNAAEAKLSDMLFPTDDKNWGLEPSPIPTMAVSGMPESEQVQGPQPTPQPTPQPPVSGHGEVGALNQGQPGQSEQLVNEQMEAEPDDNLTDEERVEREAKARSSLMEKEIEDQYTECGYQAVGREAIRLAVRLGTGIMKGPVLLGKNRRSWSPQSDDKGNTAYVLGNTPDDKPGFELVPTWDFFPTMSATRIQDSEINFQRHWMTRRDLIRLAKRGDFLKDQIRKVLRNTPDKTPPDYLTHLRSMSDISAVGDEKRYVVWERHGPIEAVDLQACGVIPIDEEVDELDEYEGVVWACQGVVIKAAVNPMDTEDQPFSVFCFEEDDSCIFGYGIPYLTRQPQKVVTRAWRMIMDNSGLSVGGQVIINKSVIEPAPAADGSISWDITPLKQWLLKDKNAKAQDAFHVFEFPNHQNELSAIFNMAKELADEESGIPPVAEGASAPEQTKTARGIEMLINSHNIVMRRAVKNWDDNMTIPNVTRSYDWNMQNNPNNDIKGDFSPKAKGSSALLQKETQSRNMLNLVNFLMTPNFVGWVKDEALVKKLVSSMQHDPDELIKTKGEHDAWMKNQQEAQAAAGQGADNSLKIAEMKNQMEIQKHKDLMQDRAEDRKFRSAMAGMSRETEMLKLSQSSQQSLQKIQSAMEQIREKNAGARQLKADDLQAKMSLPNGKVAG